ncbi:hypothetical protein KSS87_015154 [Heliosperma pusillum]|nr:hypothetical protein KSS87_015153 [Heliosperma pusillum]KAH9608810.1 hypothetical protein KSS87_015154 [Heliosperma pusillum]
MSSNTMEGSTDDEDGQRNWSNLIDEILSKIWQQHVEPQLQTDVRRRMRAVCTSWRASVPLTTATPNHRVDVPNSYDYSLPKEGLYLVENTFYLITPLANPKAVWLVRAEERGPNLFRLRNPYCGVYCLFYLFHPTCVTSKIDNLLDYQIRELHRSYTLKSSHRTHPRKLFDIDPPRVKPFRKILTLNGSDSTVFTVIALSFTGFLCFWRQGDAEWTKLMKFHDETQKDRLVETEGDRIGLGVEFALFVDITIYKEIKICFSQSRTQVTRFKINRKCYLSNCSLFECKGLLYYLIHVKHESNECEANNLFVLEDEQSESQWVSVELPSEMADQVIFLLGEASFVIPQADHLWDAGLFSTLYYVPDNLSYSDFQVRLPFKGCFKKCAFRKPKDEDDEDDDDATPSLSSDDECTSIFFPPLWLKSYYNKEGNAPVKFSELFGSLL